MDVKSFRKHVSTICCSIVWLLAITTISGWSDGPSLLRTLALGISAAAVAIPLGAMLSWLMGHSGWIGRWATVSAVALLFFPLFLHVSLWDAAFGKLGWLTSTQGEVLTPIVSGWTAAAWIHGIAATPQVAVIFRLGRSLGTLVHEEQALLDASPWSVLLHIKLKAFLSLALLAMAWVIVCCSREIAVTDIYQIGTLAEQVYLGYSMGSLGSVAGVWSTDQLRIAKEFQLGPSLLPIGCFCLLFTIGFFQLTNAAQNNGESIPNRQIAPGRTSIACGIATVLLLFVIPFANALYRSGYAVKPIDGDAIGRFEAAQAFESLRRASTDFIPEFLWSSVIAAVSASLIILFSTVFAWHAKNQRLVRWTFIFLLAVSLAVPGPLIGTIIAELLSDIRSPFLIWLYDRTIFAPVLASAVFCWPLTGMLVWFLFSRIDHHSILNIQVDGGSSWNSFWQLGIAGNTWALTGSWLVTFALSFGELSASQLVVPPGIDTLPRLMLGLLHAGVDEMTAAIAILIAAVVIVVSSFAYWLSSFSLDKSKTRS